MTCPSVEPLQMLGSSSCPKLCSMKAAEAVEPRGGLGLLFDPQKDFHGMKC